MKDQINAIKQMLGDKAVSEVTETFGGNDKFEPLKEKFRVNIGPKSTTFEVDHNRLGAGPILAYKHRHLGDLRDKANIIAGTAGVLGGTASFFLSPRTPPSPNRVEYLKGVGSVIGGPAVTATGLDLAINSTSTGELLKGIGVAGAGLGASYALRPNAMKALPKSTQALVLGGVFTPMLLGTAAVRRGIGSINEKALSGPLAEDPSYKAEQKVEAYNQVRKDNAVWRNPSILGRVASVGAFSKGLARFISKPPAEEADPDILAKIKKAEVQRRLSGLGYNPSAKEVHAITQAVDNEVNAHILEAD